MIQQIVILSFCTILVIWEFQKLSNTFKKVRRKRINVPTFEHDILHPYLKDAEWVTIKIQVRYFIFWVTVKEYSFINYLG